MRSVRQIAGICVVFSLVMLAWSAVPAAAAFIHYGDTDPTTEGWTKNVSGGCLYGGATTDDPPPATRYYIYSWGGDYMYYSLAASDLDSTSGKTVQQMLDNPLGWEAKAYMEMDAYSGNIGAYKPIAVSDGTNGWNLGIGNGWLYYEGVGGVWAGITAVTTTDKHTYGMKYSNGATSDLDNIIVSIDDSPVATLYRTQMVADTTSAPVRWGFTGPSGDWSTGWWFSTEFGAVVPEPSAVVLLATGLLGLLAYAWRKRR